MERGDYHDFLFNATAPFLSYLVAGPDKAIARHNKTTTRPREGSVILVYVNNKDKTLARQRYR